MRRRAARAAAASPVRLTNHRQKAEAVDQETGAFADHRQQQAGHRRAHHARRVEYRRVERDGVDQIFLAGHLDHQRLAAGHVEGVDHAQQAGEREHVPDLHAAGEGEGRQREGLQHRQGLSDDDHLAAGKAVGRDPAQRSQGEHGDLRAEPCGPEQKLGVGQAVDQPALRHVLHPGADQRDDLAADEQAEIAVPQGAEGVRNAAGRKFRGQRQGWILPELLCGELPSSSSRIMRGTMGDQLFVDFRRKVLAEDKLYQAEYVGSGTFKISKPKRKKIKVRQSQIRNPRRGSRK